MADAKVTESTLLLTPGGPAVATVLLKPEDAVALMVLGHGSETPIYTPIMVQLADALADQRIATFRYNYPYSQGMIDSSSGVIDSLDVLLATTSSAKDAAAALSLGLPLFLGGRSMSSQVISLALTRESWPEVRGAVLYVFPMRWRILLDDPVEHLRRVPVPMLFVQGGRDEEFTDLTELRPALAALDDRATLHVIDGADHSYDPPIGSDRTRSDALSEVASVTAAWIREQLG